MKICEVIEEMKYIKRKHLFKGNLIQILIQIHQVTPGVLIVDQRVTIRVIAPIKLKETDVFDVTTSVIEQKNAKKKHQIQMDQ